MEAEEEVKILKNLLLDMDKRRLEAIRLLERATGHVSRKVYADFRKKCEDFIAKESELTT